MCRVTFQSTTREEEIEKEKKSQIFFLDLFFAPQVCFRKKVVEKKHVPYSSILNANSSPFPSLVEHLKLIINLLAQYYNVCWPWLLLENLHKKFQEMEVILDTISNQLGSPFLSAQYFCVTLLPLHSCPIHGLSEWGQRRCYLLVG